MNMETNPLQKSTRLYLKARYICMFSFFIATLCYLFIDFSGGFLLFFIYGLIFWADRTDAQSISPHTSIRYPLFTAYLLMVPVLLTLILAVSVYFKGDFPGFLIFPVLFLPIMYFSYQIDMMRTRHEFKPIDYNINSPEPAYTLLDFKNQHFVCLFKDWEIQAYGEIKDSSLDLAMIRDNKDRYEAIIGKPIVDFCRSDFQLIEMIDYDTCYQE